MIRNCFDSRAMRLALMVWFVCVLLVCAGYGILCLMSDGRIESARVIIASDITPQKLACIEKCGTIHTQSYTYRAKLKFSSVIFRSHSGTIAIEPRSIEWIKEVGLEDSLSSFRQERADGNYIVFSTSKQLEIGSNVGVLSYSAKILSGLLSYCFSWLLLMLGIIVLPCVLKACCAVVRVFELHYPRISQASLLPPLSLKDRIFLGGSGLLVFALFVFQFWLGFPGFHIIGDTYNSIALAKDNWHPVFIAYVLQLLYFLFGKHLYYLFLFNLVPFYAGLLFLVWGFYLRFRSVFALLLLFPLFVGNIYFQNFIEYHSFALPMMLFCGYAMVLFMLLVPLRGVRAKVMWWAIGIVFFFAILWRHNAIFSVYPVSLALVYMWLANRGFGMRAFVWNYVRGALLAAFVCLSIVMVVPKILTKGESYPSVPTFLHQIAAMCVPENNSSCFKQEWYLPHKSFEDVKKVYEQYPLVADALATSWHEDTSMFLINKRLPGLYKEWLKAIAKYPRHLLIHEFNFIKAMWIQEPGWIFDSKSLQAKATHPWHKQVVSGFPESERSVVMSPLREQIYTALFTHKILFNHAWGVALSFMVMLLAFVLLVMKRNVSLLVRQLLCFSFSVGFAGFFSALFYALFTPVAEPRYMSPILPLGIMSVIGLIACVLVWRQRLDS